MQEALSSSAATTANNLVAAIEDLLSLAPDISSQYEDELQGLCSAVKSARTGFPFVLEERLAQQVNRLGSVLLGPVFTSQSHPWPVDENSRPLAPLCQLNTQEFPRPIEGVEGLIQVWLTPSDGTRGDTLIRVVPSEVAKASEMTPVITHEERIETLLPDAADWLLEVHLPSKPSRKHYITDAAIKLGCATADELSDTNWDEWTRLAEEYGEKFGDDVVPCWQISGFDNARVYCDISVDQKNAVSKLDKLRVKLEKANKPADEQTIQLLTRLSNAYGDWALVCGENIYPCLFGTFDVIQYSATERDEPIVCFESVGLREWGDGGNAQVFYSRETGFYFDWSCT